MFILPNEFENFGKEIPGSRFVLLAPSTIFLIALRMRHKEGTLIVPAQQMDTAGVRLHKKYNKNPPV
jgi:hypothetical protein